MKPPYKGRGAVGNPDGRYNEYRCEPIDDGWDTGDDRPAPRTEVSFEHPRTVIARNDSPDVPFDRAVNPYRGCEHGCIYCFSGDTPILMADNSTPTGPGAALGQWGADERHHHDSDLTAAGRRTVVQPSLSEQRQPLLGEPVREHEVQPGLSGESIREPGGGPYLGAYVRGYNGTHRHSGIQYVTPNERHQGKDDAILDKRTAVYGAAKARHPERWSGATRNWSKPEVVYLNPDKPESPPENKMGVLAA